MKSLAVLVGLLLLVAGCGGQKDYMTEADIPRFAAFSSAYQQVAIDMLGLSSALAGQDVPGARGRVDSLPRKLAATDKRVAAVRHPAVRETLADYMRKTRRAVDSLEALVAHLERAPSKRPGGDLLRELESSNAEMLNADEKLLGRVLDNTSPLLHDQIREFFPET